ncbi:MAG: hypothetical protein CMB06_02270 [Euryarchaeota archaeon]|nr:hypothetical protein [Euryarchaeota archaeon]
MKIPEHLNKPLLEQLADQADSDDFLVMRGSALGYGLLEDMEKRNEYIQKFIDTPKPELLGNELARELQARAVGMLLLDQKATDSLDQAKKLFETELEKALPNLPEDIAIDVATEPLKMARQSRSGLMENAFLRKEWKTCVNEAEHGRSIIPDYLLYQPHREGYPIEFVAKGMDNSNMDLVTKGVEMQEEFLQYVIEVGYLKPWEEAYFVSYAISLISRNLVE